MSIKFKIIAIEFEQESDQIFVNEWFQQRPLFKKKYRQMIHLYPQIKKNYYKSELKTLISDEDSKFKIWAHMDTRNPKFKFEKGKIRGPQALIDK